MRRPYPNYRDSGVEWFGEIPAHWQVKRLDHVASYRTSSVDKKTQDGELSVRLCNYTDVYYRERVRSGDGDFMQATASPSEIARFSLNVGDVLITKDSEDWRDIAVPALVEDTADDFVCGYHLGIIRTDSLADPAFVFRAMQSMAVNRQLQVSASGVTRYGLPNPAVGNALIPLPPLDEQRSIARFLDQQTTKIDELVAKKRLLQERLAEYRTALITRTVTQGLPPEAAQAAGLDPSPGLRSSEVEWLGAIPQHWEVTRLRHVCELAYGDSLPSEARELGKVPVFGSNGIVDYHNTPNTCAPVIVIGRKGSFGQVNFHDGTAFAIDTTYFVDERCTRADLRWLYYVLPCTGLTDVSMDSAVPGLSRSHAYRKSVGLPPLSEQRAIADFLDDQTERLDELRSEVDGAIERLMEYRTALVTAAVTGKIDVRNPVAAMAGSVRG